MPTSDDTTYDEPIEFDDPEIEAALTALGGLSEVPLSQHVDAFENVYRVLQDRLTQAEG
ncbi:hypothetical protein [Occultella glacieicola]|uniref:hypothetical protein n=1 Tax=Occultella glacieicola TaxID=2518684 RepID=UPI0014042780|nr:hypothetical protein [Occultella glacieicola]